MGVPATLRLITCISYRTRPGDEWDIRYRRSKFKVAEFTPGLKPQGFKQRGWDHPLGPPRSPCYSKGRRAQAARAFYEPK